MIKPNYLTSNSKVIIEVMPDYKYELGQKLCLDAKTVLFRPKIRGKKRHYTNMGAVIWGFSKQKNMIVAQLSPSKRGGIVR
jgi:hypothetical protein